MGHAKLSPSSAHRWIQCPGSVRLIEISDVDTSVSSPAAWEGTLAHEAAEFTAAYALGLTTQSERDQTEFRWRRKVKKAEFDDEEMLEHAKNYALVVREIRDDAGNAQAHLEKLVETGVPACWGTGDAIVVSDDNVTIIDYKYGKGVKVDAKDNPQLMLYGLGALKEYGDHLGPEDAVNLVIYQPRVSRTPLTWAYTVEELTEWRDKDVLPQARLALSTDGYLAPSEEACRFCPVADTCKARAKWAIERDFGSPDLLSSDEISEYLDVIPEIKKWCGQIEKKALAIATSGEDEIPGRKAVWNARKRSITKVDEAVDKLLKAGYAREDVERKQTVTFNDLDKLVGGKDKLEELLGDTLEYKSGGMTLAPEDDPRDPVDPQLEAKKAFDEEE